jgi:hypothetical protein
MGSKLQNTKLQQEPNTVEALRTWVLGDNSRLVTEHGGSKPIDRVDAEQIHRAPPIQEMHPGEPQVPLQSYPVSRDAPLPDPDDLSTNNICTSGNSNPAGSEATGDPPRIVDQQPPLRLKPSVIRRALETTALGIVVIAIGAITIAALLGGGDKADVATFWVGSDKAKLAASSVGSDKTKLAASSEGSDKAKLAASSEGSDKAKLAASSEGSDKAKVAAPSVSSDKAKVAASSESSEKAKVAAPSEPTVQLVPRPTPPNLELQQQLESLTSQLASLRNAVEQSGVKQRQMEEQLTSLKDSQQALNRSVAALTQNAQSSSRRSVRRHYSRP